MCASYQEESHIDTVVFFIICAIGLALVSVMLAIRLAAGGAPRRGITFLLAELWASLLLVAVAMISISSLLGPVPTGTPENELLDIAARWHHLSRMHQILAAAGLLLAVALFIQALLTIRKANRDYPL
jgi:hypothetical protein